MKSARIIAQEIAEILKKDVVAAVQVKDHFAENELLSLLDVTDTFLLEQTRELQSLNDSLSEEITQLRDELYALKDENKYLKLSQ